MLLDLYRLSGLDRTMRMMRRHGFPSPINSLCDEPFQRRFPR